MTQTIKKSNGTNSVSIYANHGAGNIEFKYSVELSKISIDDYLERYVGEEVSFELLEEIKTFKNGFAWECSSSQGLSIYTSLFQTKKEARAFAYSQSC